MPQPASRRGPWRLVLSVHKPKERASKLAPGFYLKLDCGHFEPRMLVRAGANNRVRCGQCRQEKANARSSG